MKPLIAGLIPTVFIAASFNRPVQQPIDKHHLSSQLDNMAVADEFPPPPTIKFKYSSPPPSQGKPASDQHKYDPKPQSRVSLSDTIGPLRSISSFSSFTRLYASSASLLADLSTNTTVLAPLNSAIDSLSRKPWETPADRHASGPQAYDGAGGQDRANRNLARFVDAHLVARSPWKQGEKAMTLAGREVWWEDKNGERVIMPDGVPVDRVASRVSNGELWILKDVIDYASTS
ncbi:hypothetical protein ED733_004236 [Metarhizium rileyi]|uniref:FAS1 domain-containing protein n=1 Tax=Metarhizium rileyi (strain RCEF 4871) TaxID=1649241 RepID=A0A5C6GIT7_METRR|nr:hypothetical protein ED733_004236 [Metarhizium rileyi]